MIKHFIRFYFNRSTSNGVLLRRAIKDAMPKAKPKQAKAEVSSSLKKVA